MNPKTSIAKTILFALGLAALPAFAAPLPEKTTLECTFPAAETVNRIKPGAQNVSDGVIRITPETWTLKICNGCAWENSGAKWKVSAKEYRATTPHGLDLAIARVGGSARLTLTTKPDDYYQGGSVESVGHCKPAAKPTKP